MPSLKDTLHPVNLTQFLEGQQPPSITGRVSVLGNTFLRSPLPPINAGPDTLRQFNENGRVPTHRVLPVPISTGGGSETVKETFNIIGGGSGGGGSVPTSAPVLLPLSATFTTLSLSSGQSGQGTLALSESYQLISVSAGGPCEIRIYGDSGSQAVDSSRGTDSPVPAELSNNIVSDVALDTAPYFWTWQNRIGSSSSNPQTTTAYLTVFNLAGFPAKVTVTVVYLPLET